MKPTNEKRLTDQANHQDGHVASSAPEHGTIVYAEVALPLDEHHLINEMQAELQAIGIIASKSDLLRAALRAFVQRPQREQVGIVQELINVQQDDLAPSEGT